MSSAESVPTTFTLPSITLDAGSEPRIELVANAELYVRRNQVLELGLTECVLSTTLQRNERMALNFFVCAVALRLANAKAATKYVFKLLIILNI